MLVRRIPLALYQAFGPRRAALVGSGDSEGQVREVYGSEGRFHRLGLGISSEFHSALVESVWMHIRDFDPTLSHRNKGAKDNRIVFINRG